MAFPIIPINAAVGSDTCGNATLRGTAASTNAGGTIVTLDGAPNLSGVPTDGSAWIQLLDATAGARNFSKITAVDDAADTVTVTPGFAANLTGKTWAINQTLASLEHANSRKLFDNNGQAGDAMPGWVAEWQNAQTETMTAQLIMRRAGDMVSGLITLRGVAGAATPPVITFSNNGNMVRLFSEYTAAYDFELRNSNASKTASIGVLVDHSGRGSIVKRIKITHATDNPWKGISIGSTSENTLVRENRVANCANVGIELGGSTLNNEIVNNRIYSNGSHGISLSSTNPIEQLIYGNLIVFNTGDGTNISTALATGRGGFRVLHNTIHGNSGDAIEITSTSTQLGAYVNTVIENNELTYNGGYALNFSGSGVTDAFLAMTTIQLRNNNHYSNTSGLSNLTLTVGENTTNIDPAGGLSASNKDYAGTVSGSDFTLNSAAKAKGYPLGGTLKVGVDSDTYSYVDQGVAQRQEPAAGGGGGIVINRIAKYSQPPRIQSNRRFFIQQPAAIPIFLRAPTRNLRASSSRLTRNVVIPGGAPALPPFSRRYCQSPQSYPYRRPTRFVPIGQGSIVISRPILVR